MMKEPYCQEMGMRSVSLALAIWGVIVTSAAYAHVTLERPEAPVGASYKAVFRVPHGCGTSPTLRVSAAHSRRCDRRQADAKAGLADRDGEG